MGIILYEMCTNKFLEEIKKKAIPELPSKFNYFNSLLKG